MNLFEIFGNMHQALQTAWDAVAALSGWVTGGLVCSVTVNLVVLSVVLLGAVRLLGPFELWRRR